MQIEGIRVSTPTLNLKADKISGRQLWRALERLGGPTTQPAASGLFPTANTPGSGAVRRPSEQFAATGPSLANDPSSGFAAGGPSQTSSLDSNGVLDMLMRLLQQLVSTLLQMLSGQGGQPSGSSGQGGQPSGGSGQGGQPGSCGGGRNSGAQSGGIRPSTGTPQPPSSGSPLAPGGGLPMPPAGPPPSSGGTSGPGLGSVATTPPRNGGFTPRPSGCRPRPRNCGSGIGRILARIGQGAMSVAGGASTGGPLLAAAAGTSMAGRGNVLATQSDGLASALSGGSLEERLAVFFRGQLKYVEGRLEAAMQEAQQAGGADGDSRALATSKVQQLVSKRSEMIEMLTNTLKTAHESAIGVARNLK